MASNPWTKNDQGMVEGGEVVDRYENKYLLLTCYFSSADFCFPVPSLALWDKYDARNFMSDPHTSKYSFFPTPPRGQSSQSSSVWGKKPCSLGDGRGIPGNSTTVSLSTVLCQGSSLQAVASHVSDCTVYDHPLSYDPPPPGRLLRDLGVGNN